jgi:hypothetical protein
MPFGLRSGGPDRVLPRDVDPLGLIGSWLGAGTGLFLGPRRSGAPRGVPVP